MENPINHFEKFKQMTKFKLTKKQHNLFFKNRQRTFWNDLFLKYEYYIDTDSFKLVCLYTLYYKILSTILFPVSILFLGLNSFKETFDDLKKLWDDRRQGRFISDTYWRKSKIWEDIELLAYRGKK